MHKRKTSQDVSDLNQLGESELELVKNVRLKDLF